MQICDRCGKETGEYPIVNEDGDILCEGCNDVLVFIAEDNAQNFHIAIANGEYDG